MSSKLDSGTQWDIISETPNRHNIRNLKDNTNKIFMAMLANISKTLWYLKPFYFCSNEDWTWVIRPSCWPENGSWLSSSLFFFFKKFTIDSGAWNNTGNKVTELRRIKSLCSWRDRKKKKDCYSFPKYSRNSSRIWKKGNAEKKSICFRNILLKRCCRSCRHVWKLTFWCESLAC